LMFFCHESTEVRTHYETTQELQNPRSFAHGKNTALNISRKPLSVWSISIYQHTHRGAATLGLHSACEPELFEQKKNTPRWPCCSIRKV